MKKNGPHTPEFRHPMPPPNPNPDYVPPASVHVPERRIPAAPKPSELITISVAEYHFLTKTATMLETILNAKSYHVEAVVDSVRATIDSMTGQAEAGAEE